MRRSVRKLIFVSVACLSVVARSGVLCLAVLLVAAQRQSSRHVRQLGVSGSAVCSCAHIEPCCSRRRAAGGGPALCVCGEGAAEPRVELAVKELSEHQPA